MLLHNLQVIEHHIERLYQQAQTVRHAATTDDFADTKQKLKLYAIASDRLALEILTTLNAYQNPLSQNILPLAGLPAKDNP